MKKILEYLNHAEKYSQDSNKNVIILLLKIIFCRIFYRIGPKFFCLYRLDNKIFRSGSYIQKHVLDAMQEKINHKDYIYLADNKIKFYEKCSEENIPTPDILAIIDLHTKAKHKHNNVIRTEEEFNVFINSLKDGFYVFKSALGSYGEGMLVLEVKNGVFKNVAANRLVDPKSIYVHFLNYSDPFILQEKLKNSDDIKHVMGENALGTIRVVSYVPENGSDVMIPYAFAKIPIGNSINDNFSHGESGNLLCGVDPQSGCMMRAFGKGGKSVTLETFESHPETGAIFNTQPIPRWECIVELVKRAAIKFMPIKTIGWDVAITETGVFLLEANWHYDPDGPQVTLERGIKDEIEKLYSQ